MLCFFFKQKTAYEMRISDWSSDVCSSDLAVFPSHHGGKGDVLTVGSGGDNFDHRVLLLNFEPSFSACRASVLAAHLLLAFRSEERRVGKECVSTCRSRWSPYH